MWFSPIHCTYNQWALFLTFPATVTCRDCGNPLWGMYATHNLLYSLKKIYFGSIYLPPSHSWKGSLGQNLEISYPDSAWGWGRSIYPQEYNVDQLSEKCSPLLQQQKWFSKEWTVQPMSFHSCSCLSRRACSRYNLYKCIGYPINYNGLRFGLPTYLVQWLWKIWETVPAEGRLAAAMIGGSGLLHGPATHEQTRPRPIWDRAAAILGPHEWPQTSFEAGTF